MTFNHKKKYFNISLLNSSYSKKGYCFKSSFSIWEYLKEYVTKELSPSPTLLISMQMFIGEEIRTSDLLSPPLGYMCTHSLSGAMNLWWFQAKVEQILKEGLLDP